MFQFYGLFVSLDFIGGKSVRIAEKKTPLLTIKENITIISPQLIGGVSPSGKATGFGPVIRGFESLYPIHFSTYRGIEQFGSSSGS